METKRCEECGKEYVPYGRREQYTCGSGTCRAARFRRLHREARSCSVCGKSMPKGRHRYCSDECKRAAESESRRKNPPKKKPYTCRLCGWVRYLRIPPDTNTCRRCSLIEKTYNKVCDACGEAFISKGPRTRYCDSCVTAALKAAREYSAKAKKISPSRAPVTAKRAINISTVQHCPASRLEDLIQGIVSGEILYRHNGVTA